MTGMNIQTATQKIYTFLATNLTDPLSKRTSGWVYQDNLRIDLDKTGFPKILIKHKEEPTQKEQLGIGNVATENTDRIFIEFKTLSASTYLDNDDDTKYNATEFASLMAQRAEDLIKLNGAYFVTNGFLHVICVEDIIEDDKDRNPTFRLGIEMKYISTPN